eukprot:GHVH01011466.1.p1 GENE.GHVH01011466.1~~GHVH01011466.1.p1  ORF type:complete len:1267 (+),score=230.35 GHVH01011466.1:169-3969(+)
MEIRQLDSRQQSGSPQCTTNRHLFGDAPSLSPASSSWAPPKGRRRILTNPEYEYIHQNYLRGQKSLVENHARHIRKRSANQRSTNQRSTNQRRRVVLTRTPANSMMAIMPIRKLNVSMQSAVVIWDRDNRVLKAHPEMTLKDFNTKLAQSSSCADDELCESDSLSCGGPSPSTTKLIISHGLRVVKNELIGSCSMSTDLITMPPPPVDAPPVDAPEGVLSTIWKDITYVMPFPGSSAPVLRDTKKRKRRKNNFKFIPKDQLQNLSYGNCCQVEDDVQREFHKQLRMMFENCSHLQKTEHLYMTALPDGSYSHVSDRTDYMDESHHLVDNLYHLDDLTNSESHPDLNYHDSHPSSELVSLTSTVVRLAPVKLTRVLSAPVGKRGQRSSEERSSLDWNLRGPNKEQNKEEQFQDEMEDKLWRLKEKFDLNQQVLGDDSDSQAGDLPPPHLSRFFNVCADSKNETPEVERLHFSAFGTDGLQFNQDSRRLDVVGEINENWDLPGCGDIRGITGLSSDDVRRIWSSRVMSESRTQFKTIDELPMPQWPTKLLSPTEALIESPSYKLDYNTVEGVAQPSCGGFWEELKDFCSLQVPKKKWLSVKRAGSGAYDPEDPVNYLNGQSLNLKFTPARWSRRTPLREQAEALLEEEMKILKNHVALALSPSPSLDSESSASSSYSDQSGYDLREKGVEVQGAFQMDDKAANEPSEVSKMPNLKYKRWGYNSPLKRTLFPSNDKSFASTEVGLDRDLSREAQKIINIWDNAIPAIYQHHFNVQLLTDESSWHKGGHSTFCHGCDNTFGGIMFRRHHCRMCGFAFCASCSPFTIRLQPHRLDVRICMLCFKGGMLRAAVERLYALRTEDMTDDLKIVTTAINTDQCVQDEYKRKIRDIYDEFIMIRTKIQTCQLLNDEDFSLFDPYVVDNRYGHTSAVDVVQQMALPSLLVDIGQLMSKIVDKSNKVYIERNALIGQLAIANENAINLRSEHEDLMTRHRSRTQSFSLRSGNSLHVVQPDNQKIRMSFVSQTLANDTTADVDLYEIQDVEEMRSILESYQDKYSLLKDAYVAKNVELRTLRRSFEYLQLLNPSEIPENIVKSPLQLSRPPSRISLVPQKSSETSRWDPSFVEKFCTSSDSSPYEEGPEFRETHAFLSNDYDHLSSGGTCSEYSEVMAKTRKNTHTNRMQSQANLLSLPGDSPFDDIGGLMEMLRDAYHDHSTHLDKLAYNSWDLIRIKEWQEDLENETDASGSKEDLNEMCSLKYPDNPDKGKSSWNL